MLGNQVWATYTFFSAPVVQANNINTFDSPLPHYGKLLIQQLVNIQSDKLTKAVGQPQTVQSNAAEANAFTHEFVV